MSQKPAKEDKNKIPTEQDIANVKAQVMSGMIQMVDLLSNSHTKMLANVIEKNNKLTEEIRLLKSMPAARKTKK